MGQRQRKREREDTQVECLSIGETTRAFFRVETFDSVSEDAKNLYLSVSLSFFSHSPFSRTAVIFAPSSLPFCFATWWKVFIVASPDSPARLLVLFSSSTIRAQVRSHCRGGSRVGPYRPLLLDCGKPRPGYEREDLIKTKRNEPRKTTGVHLSGSRGSGLLFLRSSFYLAISGLCFGLTGNRPLATAFILPHYVEYARPICRMNNIEKFSICS